MGVDQGIEIIRVKSGEQIEEVVSIHREVFVDNLSGDAGRRFIKYFFEKVAASPNGIIYVCRDNEKTVGFIAGMSFKENFFDAEFMRRGFMAFLAQLFSRPSIVFNILFQLKRSMTTAKSIPEAELLSIGVKKGYRQSGAGKKLVHALEEFFRTKGIKDYKVYTDAKFVEAIKFYEGLGFFFLKQFNFLKISERLYLKKI